VRGQWSKSNADPGTVPCARAGGTAWDLQEDQTEGAAGGAA